MNTVSINGQSLDIKTVIEVAINHAVVKIDKSVWANVQQSQQFVEKQVADSNIVYGVTTGFGPNASMFVSDPKDAVELQRNLIISHAVGCGKPLHPIIVRAMMLIRLNTLLAGHSGIRQEVLELLLALINKDICPLVPEQGSVGASGDLCPLAHIALTIIGEGDTFVTVVKKGAKTRQRTSAKAALRNHGLKPVKITYKEGLALINGTTLMTALGAIAVYRAKRLVNLSAKASSLAFEALCARKEAFDPRIHELRRHKGQQKVAKQVRKTLEGSALFGISSSELLAALQQRFKLDAKLNEASIVEDFIETLQAYLESTNPSFKKLKVAKLSSTAIDKIQAACHNEAMFNKVINLTEVVASLQEKGIRSLLHPRHSQALIELAPNVLFDTLEQVVAHETNVPEWQQCKTIIRLARKKLTPQDAYSVRCTPQVLGASRQAISHAQSIVEAELNAVVDNPLLFTNKSGKGEFLSGGNFHGQPLAIVLDYLKIAVAEMGNLLERQLNKLVDPATSDLLPAFLAEHPGLHSGYMIYQYAAASLVSENKVLSHPASVDSIPTSANQEDHVSMGPIAGRHCLDVLDNVENILIYHLIAAAQALDMRVKQFQNTHIPLTLGAGTAVLHSKIRQYLPYTAVDGLFHQDFELLKSHLKDIYILS
jgi:histidine ammonia-lyase